MKTIIRGCVFLTVLAVSCAGTAKNKVDDDVWALLANGDDRARGYFLGEVDANSHDERGRTPLHYAAERNDPQLAAFFIAMGAEVDAFDNEGLTPLAICPENGHGETAKALVAAGANIHHQTRQGMSVARAAIIDTTFLPAILSPASLESTDANGRTIIHLAAESGNVGALKIIIEANTDSRLLAKNDSSGDNPLDIALDRPDSRDHIECAERLILAGASSNNAIAYYFSPAVKNANYDLRRSSGQAPLHYAAADGLDGLAVFLIEKKADVNIKNSAGMTPLHEAARAGNLDMIRYLLRCGADINAQDARGNSVLHIAVPPQDHAEMIQLFLKNGIHPNLRDEHGDSPLHVLVSLNRNRETLLALMDSDVDVSARNINGQSPLYLAVRDSRLDLIPPLLERGSDVFAADNAGVTPFDLALKSGGDILESMVTRQTVQQKDSEGNTMLHVAVRNASDVETITMILNEQANINFRNRDGDTALHIAARMNNREAGEYLLSRGADIFYSNSTGESPLYIALTHPDGILQWMLNERTVLAHDGQGNTMLHYVSLWKMDRYIPFIIEKGCSTEAANATGETPLFWAVKHDGESTVRTLLAHKANLHVRDSLGNSVLHAAVRWNAKDTVNTLLGAGIDANVHSLDMTTPLHEAVRLGMNDIAVILINGDADTEVRDTGGNTPLMEAVKAGYAEAANLLIATGANVMTRNANGDTPLHVAVMREDAGIIHSLLNRDASIHARNAGNRTPFQIAVQISPEMARVLLTENRVLLSDDFGNSPLHIAVQEHASMLTVKAIIDKGCRLGAVDSNGRIPLRLAIDLNEWVLARVLADAGSDPFSVSSDNKTSAEVVLLRDSYAIRSAFSGKAINARDVSGNTILHYAARMGKPETISLLLELGATKTTRNISAESPADIALRWNNRENAVLLN